MKRRERVFCDDCPGRDRVCATDENRCEVARWAHEQTKDLPPLSPDQIRKIAILLGG